MEETRIYNAAGPDEICIVSRVNYYHPVNLSCLAHLTHPRTFHLHSPLLPVLFLETRELYLIAGPQLLSSRSFLGTSPSCHHV